MRYHGVDFLFEQVGRWFSSQRGYPTPSAMISSKPGAGFNHKEYEGHCLSAALPLPSASETVPYRAVRLRYGVTSEGVNVFLRVALEEAGAKKRFFISTAFPCVCFAF